MSTRQILLKKHKRKKRDKKPVEEKKEKPYIDEAKTTWEHGAFSLKAPVIPDEELPMISILTITKNRSHMFILPLHNWKNFNYPKDKIEWVIIDDSETDKLKDLLPDDSRIKYVYHKVPMKIAEKRNYGMKRCKGEYISIMDDDDYHFPDSILSKIRILFDHPEKDCVISSPIGFYDVHSETSVISNSNDIDIPENTMMFKKRYWKNHRFGNGPNNESEWYNFCYNNSDKLINVSFWFNIIALNHKENHHTLPKQMPGFSSFNKIWGRETKEVIYEFHKNIIKEQG
jgi:glycosyltransferase involved in cell wall biosynthesis